MLFYCLFQYFEEKEYQTESKRNETFGRVIFGTNVIRGLGVDVKKETREPRGREVRLPPWARPHPRGHLEAFLTSTPSLLDCFRSKNNAPEGFIPFGLCLIFLFFEILKQAIKQQYGLGLWLIA